MYHYHLIVTISVDSIYIPLLSHSDCISVDSTYHYYLIVTVSLLTVQHSFTGLCLYTTIVLHCLCHCKQYNIPWCTTFLQGTLCYIHLCCLTVIVSVYSAMFLLTTLWTGIALLHSVSVCTLQTMHCSLRRKTYKKSTLLHNLMRVSGLYKFLRVTYLIRKSNSPQPDVCVWTLYVPQGEKLIRRAHFSMTWCVCLYSTSPSSSGRKNL